MTMKKWLQMPVQERELSWARVRDIPIDCTHPLFEEPLVEISTSSRLNVYSAYYHDHIHGALKRAYTRASILQKLQELLLLLPENIGIIVLDAWRPIAVQEALRHNFRESLVVDYPELNAQEIEDILNQFVAKPSTDILAPSPHLTGGSIDLTLFDTQTRCELDMGTSFDAMDEASWSHYFEARSDSLEARTIRDHRRMLIHGMASVGFSNLPSEWWHFDYGNQLWANESKQHAFYGMTEPSNSGQDGDDQ